MTDKQHIPTSARAASRRRDLRRWLVIGGLILALQSITVTLPVTVRYVDAVSGNPIAGLPVTAVWRLSATHLAGSLPSTVLKVQHLQTNQQGDASIGLAVMLHAPIFPFGLNVRPASSLPALYVVDDRYQGRLVANDPFDVQRPAPMSVLSLRRTSIDEATVSLLPAGTAEAAAARDEEHIKYLFSGEIRGAAALCSQRWLCQKD